MIATRLKVFLVSFLITLIGIQGSSAGESFDFPTFNTTEIVSGTAGFTKTLDVTSLPAGEYVYVNVSANYTAAASPADAYSNTMRMELSNGSSTIYWQSSIANYGAQPNSNATVVRWVGVLPRSYVTGALVVKFVDPNTTGGTYKSTLTNVAVSLSQTATPKYTIPSVNITNINSGSTTGVNQALNVSGVPASEYYLVTVTGDFVASAPPKATYSTSMRMELNNGGSTIYLPALPASSGAVATTANAALRWSALLPKNYVGGSPLSVRITDISNIGGPYTSAVNNVVVTLHPVPADRKTFASYTSGTINSSIPAGTSQSLNVTGIPTGDFVTMKVTADFVGGSNPAYSETIRMELNNGGSTIFWPATYANTGKLLNANPTQLTWVGALPISYTGGTPLSVKFTDTYNTGGPYTSTLNNVTVSLISAASSAPAPTTISSLNRVDATPSKAATVNYLLTFPTAVTGVTASNFSLNPTLTGASIGTPTTANSGLTWTIPVTTGTADGTLQLNVANATGFSTSVSNTLPFSGQSYTIDKTAPTLSIGALSATLTKAGPVTYTVTYGDANTPTSTLAPGNITLNKTGTANASIAVTGTGLIRTVTLSSITGDGTIGISIAAGTASDPAGNTAPAAGPSATFIVDNTAPSFTSATTANGTFNTAFSYTIAAPDAVSYTATPLPTGLTLTGAVISGTPTQTGVFNIPLGATDAAGNTSSTTLVLTIAKASATVTLGSLAQTYNGTARPITATTTPAGLTVNFTYNGSATAPINAGSYTVAGTIGDANYQGTASGTLVVSKASATVVLGNTTQTYNATPRPVTATTTPANLPVTFSYNGSPTAPTNASSTSVTATINDTNYQGTASGTLAINKAQLTVTPDPKSRAFGTANPVLTATITGFGGGENASVVSGTPAFVTTAGPNSPVGDYPVTASTGTLTATNYSFTFIPGLLTVTRVNFDSWNDTYFTPAELANPAISGESADADGDGISNLLEFAFGTNPRVNESGPRHSFTTERSMAAARSPHPANRSPASNPRKTASISASSSFGEIPPPPPASTTFPNSAPVSIRGNPAKPSPPSSPPMVTSKSSPFPTRCS